MALHLPSLAELRNTQAEIQRFRQRIWVLQGVVLAWSTCRWWNTKTCSSRPRTTEPPYCRPCRPAAPSSTAMAWFWPTTTLPTPWRSPPPRCRTWKPRSSRCPKSSTSSRVTAGASSDCAKNPKASTPCRSATASVTRKWHALPRNVTDSPVWTSRPACFVSTPMGSSAAT